MAWGFLRVAEPLGTKRLFVPLKRTRISGDIHGIGGSCSITQIFSFQKSSYDHPIEAVYRFPLPGDAIFYRG